MDETWQVRTRTVELSSWPCPVVRQRVPPCLVTSPPTGSGRVSVARPGLPQGPGPCRRFGPSCCPAGARAWAMADLLLRYSAILSHCSAQRGTHFALSFRHCSRYSLLSALPGLPVLRFSVPQTAPWSLWNVRVVSSLSSQRSQGRLLTSSAIAAWFPAFRGTNLFRAFSCLKRPAVCWELAVFSSFCQVSISRKRREPRLLTCAIACLFPCVSPLLFRAFSCLELPPLVAETWLLFQVSSSRKGRLCSSLCLV